MYTLRDYLEFESRRKLAFFTLFVATVGSASSCVHIEGKETARSSHRQLGIRWEGVRSLRERTPLVCPGTEAAAAEMRNVGFVGRKLISKSLRIAGFHWARAMLPASNRAFSVYPLRHAPNKCCEP